MREGSNKLPFFLKSKKELISLDNILQMQGIPLELRRALGSLGSLAIPFGTPVNAAAGTDVLTIDGAVIDGETVTIGADVYEFAADAKQTVTAGRIAVDITAKTTAAQGKLTVAVQPTAGEKITIGTKEYIFVALGTAAADGDIDIGADLAAAKLNIVAAINGTDLINDEHPLVSAANFAVDDCIITAKVGGVAGNAIASTTDMQGAGNKWDAGTLGTERAGVDCTKGDARTALIEEINRSGTEPFTAAEGTVADTMTITANAIGPGGNGLVLLESGANMVWTAGVTAGGVDGTPGFQGAVCCDAGFIYICTATDTTILNNNWERVAIAGGF